MRDGAWDSGLHLICLDYNRLMHQNVLIKLLWLHNIAQWNIKVEWIKVQFDEIRSLTDLERRVRGSITDPFLYLNALTLIGGGSFLLVPGPIFRELLW